MKLKNRLKWAAVHLPELLAAIGLVIIVLLAGSNAITRYAFRFTLWFADDCIVVAFAWSVFAGAAAAYRKMMHYGIDFLNNALPEHIRQYFNIIVQTITTVIMGYLTYLSIILVKNIGSKILWTTGISYKYVDAAVIFGFAMMTIYSAIFVVRDVRTLVCERKKVTK